MATPHPKPLTAAGWRFDNPTTNPPDWTAAAFLQQGRFQWEYVEVPASFDPVFSHIYLPWGTDVRMGTVADRTLGDLVILGGMPAVIYKVNWVYYINAGTDAQELRAQVFPIIWSFPL